MKFHRTFLRSLLAAFCGILCFIFLHSSDVLAAPQINNQINYQARLMDASGFPVADGNYSIYFSLYDASTGGTRLWTATGTLATPTPLTVNVQNGLFTVLLGDTSSAGGSQNTLDMVNWNSDQIYLGVTINADAEMVPRKRFASAPQAFNARQLQGMYASSTASGGQTLFTLNQTQNDAATGTRSTLDVRSSGTSNSNDFLIRGVNDTNAVVFSINRQGSVTSTNVFVSGLTSSTNLNANIASFATATVAGQGICLSNGQFCSTGSTPEADTLQTVSNRGAFTTTTLTLFGGLTASNITATGTLNVTGASTLAGITFTNATGINATTTNLFATNLLYTASTGTSAFVSSFGFTTASGTSFTANIGTFATATVMGSAVCLQSGVGCPAGTVLSDTLQSVTARGSFTTTTVQFFGGLSTSNLTATGTTSLQGTTFTNTTGSNVTTTALGVLGTATFTNATASTLQANFASFASATVAGQGICLQNGVGCPSATAEADTLQTVSNRGSFTTTTLTLFGGLTASNITATGTLNVSGASSLSGLTFTNATGANVTSTGYFSFNIASGTTLNTNAFNFGSGTGGSLNITTALTVNGVNVCLQDNTNCPVSGGSASDGNWVFNSSTQQLYQVTTTLDVLIGGSSQPSSPFVFLNNATDSRLVVGGGTALADVVIGAATSIGLNTAFQLTGDDLFVQGNIGSVSSVYTNGAFIAGSGSTYYGNGYINKNDGNLTIDASGGFITPSNDLAVSLGSATNRYNAIFGNVTSTNSTSTNLFAATGTITALSFNTATGTSVTANIATFATATVSGQAVCLANGIGCPAGTSLSDTLQSVTARGSFTTSSLQFFGGFVAASSSVTGTLNVSGSLSVTGTSNLQGVNFTSATGTSATTTNLFATNAGVTNLVYTGSTGTTATSSQLFWNNATGANLFVYDAVIGDGTSTNFFVNTTLGFANATGVTLTANNLIATTSSITGINFRNATGVNLLVTNATTTNLAVQGTFNASNLLWTNATGTFLTVTTSTQTFSSIRNVSSTQLNINTALIMRLGQASSVGSPTEVFVSGRYAYVNSAAFADINIYDISDPSAPTSVSSIQLPGGNSGNAYVVGDYLYTGDQGTNLRIYDISNRRVPQLVSQLAGPTCEDCIVSGRYLYSVDSNSFDIVDVTNATAPRRVFSTSTTNGEKVRVQGSYAYAILGGNSVRIFDVTNATSPIQIANIALTSPQALAVSGRYLYVNNSTVVRVYDIADPYNPTLMGSVTIGNTPGELDIAGKYLYATHNDLSVIDVSSSTNPFVVIQDATLGSNGIDVYGRYGVVGISGGIQIIDFGGLETHAARIGALEVGSITGWNDADFGGTLRVGTSLQVGRQGIFTLGSLAVGATNTTSTIEYAVSSTRGEFTAGLSVGGIEVCLSNGTNCGAVGADTLLTVTNRGAIATSTLFLYGGFISGSSTVTSTLNVTGNLITFSSSSLRGIDFTNATGLNVTTTNLFATLGSFTTATATNANINILNAATGTISNLNFFNSTGTFFFASTGTFVTVTTTNLYVSGQTVCLSNGTNCPTAGLDTLQSVTARGSFTTTTAQLFGGFVAASSSVTGTLDIAGFLNVTGSMDVALTATSNPVSIKVPLPNANDRSSGFSISTVGSSTGIVAQKIRAFGFDLSAFAFTDNIADPVSASGALAYYSHTGNAFALSLLEAGSSMSDLTLYNTNNGGTQNRAAMEIKNYAGVSSTAVLRLANDAGSAGIVQHVGAGSPEGTVYAELGSIYFNSGGGTSGTQAYLKTADAGANGWVGIATVDMLSAGSETLLTVTNRGSVATATLTLYGGFVAASSSVTGTFAVAGTSTLFRDAYVGTSTYSVTLNSDFVINGDDLYVADNIGSVSSIFSNGMLVAGETGPTLFGDGFINQTDGALVISADAAFLVQPSISIIAGDVTSGLAGDVNIRAGDGQGGNPAGNINLTPGDSLGQPGHVFLRPVTGSSNTPQFRFTSLGGGYISLESPSTSNSVNFVLPFADGASSTVIGTNGSGALTFVSVCLTDGTNCPAGIGSDLNWTFNLAGDFVRNATATTDIAIGSSTIGNAPFAFLNNTTTSRLLIGQNTTTGARADLVIGATTATGMNSLFQLTGDDLYVQGNIGSASSVYTNGAFIAGLGSTLYGDGYIARTTGDIVVSASSNVVRPSSNNTLSLGSVTSSFRNIFASGTIAFGTASGSALNLVTPTFTLATSTQFSTFPTGVAVRNNIAYLADNNLYVLDVTNPSAPTLIASSTALNAGDLTLVGDYAYLSANGLRIVDISRPARPVSVGYYANGLGGSKPAISGPYAYMGGQDFQIVDISNPAAPTSTAIVTLTGSVGGVDVQGKFAYVSNGTTFRIYDVSDPLNPVATGTLAGFTSLGTVQVSGRYAYVVDNLSVRIIDISNVASPSLIATFATDATIQVNDVIVAGRYLYISKHTEGVDVVDVSTPSSPVRVGGYNTPGAAFGMSLSGKQLYVADFGSGLAILDLGGADISSAKIGSIEMGSGQVLNNLDIGGQLNVGGGIVAGLEGIFTQGPIVGSSISVSAASYATSSRTSISSNGKQIAVHNGVAAIYDGELITSNQLIYNVSDPTDPMSIASILADNNHADLVFKGDYLYQVGSIINVYDLSNPSYPQLVASTTGAAPYSAFLSGLYLYLTRDAKLVVYDISDSTQLTELGTAQLPCTLCIIGSNQTNGLYVKEGYAYMTDVGTDNFYIIDVSDPTAPTHTSFISGFSNPQGVVAEGNYAYMVESGSSELNVINITSSTEPFVARTISSGQTTPTEIALAGNYLFVGGSTGIAVFDVSSSTNPYFVTTLASGAVQDMQIEGNRLHVGTASAYIIYEIPSIKAPAMLIGSVQAGTGLIETDFTVGNHMYVGGDLQVGGSILARSTIRASGLEVAGFTGVSATQIGGTVTADKVKAMGDYVYTLEAGPSRVRRIYVNEDGYATQTAVGVLSAGTVSDALDVAGDYIYVANSSNGLVIFENDPASSTLRQISTTTLPGGAAAWESINVQGNKAYISSNGGLFIYDVSNPRAPVYVGEFDDGGTFNSNFSDVDGDYLYSSECTDGLKIIDISNPSRPVKVATAAAANCAYKVTVSNGYAYVGQSTNPYGILVYDVRQPTNPILRSTIFDANGAQTPGLERHGNYLFAADAGGGLTIYDVSSSTRPIRVYTEDPIFYSGSDVSVAGSRAFLATNSELRIYSLPKLDAPSAEIGSINAGTLFVDEDGYFESNVNIQNGLTVGIGGVLIQGPSSISASSVSSVVSIINTASTTYAWGAYINSLLLGNDRRLPGADDHAMFVSASSENAVVRIRNTHTTGISPFTAWGLWTDNLAVSNLSSAPAVADLYTMYLDYASGTDMAGICIDDTSAVGGCPVSGVNGRSILADGTISANFFDVAERYSVSGTAEIGDLLIYESLASSTVTKHTGTAYDAKLIGIVSMNPGLELGFPNPSSTDIAVALAGRVPTKISMNNGEVRIGDPLTSSDVPGYAMKATKPGMIVGYALEDASATGTIEVFVDVGYWAGNVLATDGSITTVNDAITFTASTSATALNPTADSWGLTFRGDAWDASSTSVVASSFTLLTDILSATSSRFSIQSTSGTNLFSIDQEGNASVAGSLSVAGKFYPSSKGGGLQDDWYVFVDDTSSTAAYISTNAEGWQSMDTYDFAERYYSPDELEPGDLVAVSDTGFTHVQRTLNETQMVLGIVSTRPAFIAGRPATSTYPIALSGRVPTKVSGMNGAIKAGDPLAPTTIPGVAAKAVKTGPIVGIALEDYDQSNVGSIEVFVNAGWWTNKDEVAQQTTVVNQTFVNEASGIVRRGVAMIAAGSKKVRVTYDSIGAYPFVQVTPRGLIQGNWGTDNYSDIGFDIVLSQEQSFDAYFSWQVEPLQGSDQLNLSDGTTASIDPVTGLPFGFTTPSSTEAAIDEVPTSTESSTTSEVLESVIEESVSTSTDYGSIDNSTGVMSAGEVSTSTNP